MIVYIFLNIANAFRKRLRSLNNILLVFSIRVTLKFDQYPEIYLQARLWTIPQTDWKRCNKHFLEYMRWQLQETKLISPNSPLYHKRVLSENHI